MKLFHRSSVNHRCGESEEFPALTVNRWAVKQFHGDSLVFTFVRDNFVGKFEKEFHMWNSETFSPVFHRFTGSQPSWVARTQTAPILQTTETEIGGRLFVLGAPT